MPPWNDALAALYAAVNTAQRPDAAPSAAEGASGGAVCALFSALAEARGQETLDAFVDVLLVELDAVITRQLNAIMHHPSFQQLEGAWRSLFYLVEHIDFSQNIRLVFMNLSMDDLKADFEDSPDVTRSGLYKHVYTAEYGQYGGQPIAAIIADYEFSASRSDIDLLQQASRVAAMAHAPFIASAGRSFFGINSWQELAAVDSMKTLFGTPQYTAWKSFRKTDASRYAALTVPVFLLRLPYGNGVNQAESFAFEEDSTEFDSLCWGKSAFFLAVRMAESFADHRWCMNLVGARDDAQTARFLSYDFDSTRHLQSRIPMGIAFSERREHELAEEGFMALVLRRGQGDAVFYSANSCNNTDIASSGRAARDENVGIALAAQLPYMMIINRIAHYIKVIQRDNIGLWRNARMVEQELNKWVNQYVTAMDDPDPVTRGRRPLREAKISVYNADENAQWYSVNIQIKPHFKYLGATFTLSLLSRLEK